MMTDREENQKNLEELLSAANRLPEEDKKVVQDTLQLLVLAAERLERGETYEAVSEGFRPLIGMLVFEFLRQFVASHMPEEEKLKHILVEGLRAAKVRREQP